MICRVCNQPISFVKGSRPGKRKRSSWAVHDSELSQALEQPGIEMVTPHPGNQRKLRQELEDAHRQGQTAAQQTQNVSGTTSAQSNGRDQGTTGETSNDYRANERTASPAQDSTPTTHSAGASQSNQPHPPQQQSPPIPNEEVPGASVVNHGTDQQSGGDNQQTHKFGA